MEHKKNIELKFATVNDIPLILSLIKALADFEKLSDQVVATEDVLKEQLFSDKPKAEVIICYVEGNAVGFALFFHNFSTFLGRAGIYLEDLYVMPEYRGQGVAKKVLVFLAKLAISRKCGRLEWSCLDWNTKAIDFYLSLGAIKMDEWTQYRVTGKNLINLAEIV